MQHSTALLKSCRQLFWLGGQQILTWKNILARNQTHAHLKWDGLNWHLGSLGNSAEGNDPDEQIVKIDSGPQILKNFSK